LLRTPLREAGLTKQRLPSALGSGGFTDSCTSSLICLVKLLEPPLFTFCFLWRRYGHVINVNEFIVDQWWDYGIHQLCTQGGVCVAS